MSAYTKPEQAIEKACEIVALAYHSIADYSSSSDGFCGKCLKRFTDADVLDGWRNKGEALEYVQKAVVEQLKRDGFKIDPGFDQVTGSILKPPTEIEVK